MNCSKWTWKRQTYIPCAYTPTDLHAAIRLTMKALQVVTVLVTFLMLGHAIQTEYFVRPNEGTPCPALPCHTLSHYLENIKRYFTSNTRISFLHGVHEINKSGVFYIKDVSKFTMFSNLKLARFLHVIFAVCELDTLYPVRVRLETSLNYNSPDLVTFCTPYRKLSLVLDVK